MLKNDEIKKHIFIQFIFVILIIIVCLVTSNYQYKLYKKEQIKTNSYIVGTIIKHHPEFENDLITSIVLKQNYDLGYKTLQKYGLANVNSLEYNDLTRKRITQTNIIIVISSLFILFIMNMLFIKKTYKKIYKIDRYMNSILNGDYSLNIKDYCEGDISNLKNDTYKMTVKLKEQSELLLKDKKYLEETLEDISHQIKTPLTSMYMINDILSSEKNEIVRHDFIKKNENQIKRIEWLITSLLKMSRLDSGTIKLKNDKIRLIDLVNRAIEPIRVLIELKNINLELDVDDGVVIADMNWTSEALLNIIKNACEHTKDKIVVKTSMNPIYTEITISDNGEGISKDDLPHIFERFYKGSHNKDSIGIGLNMSKKIINLQNGTIEVETKKDVGTTFSIKLFKNIIWQKSH